MNQPHMLVKPSKNTPPTCSKPRVWRTVSFTRIVASVTISLHVPQNSGTISDGSGTVRR